MTTSRYVLIIQHVPWETPGAIETALSGLPTRTISVIDEADPVFPPTNDLAGLVVLGGPMNADDVLRYPGLAAERRLLASAVDAELPTLGICLGGQLLARALGAPVHRGIARELGWAPVSVTDGADPLLGPLAPATPVLHWHSDVFDLPVGATPLASTKTTPIQAFRAGNAWALQFHIEVTTDLVASWLAEPVMRGEAEGALGKDWRNRLTRQTGKWLGHLEPAAGKGLAAFANFVRARQSA